MGQVKVIHVVIFQKGSSYFLPPNILFEGMLRIWRRNEDDL